MTRDSVYFQGQEKLNQWLARVVKETSDLKPLFDDLGDILLDGIHDRFDRGVAPNGKPWQKSWRAIAQGGKTGRDTGRLLNSFLLKQVMVVCRSQRMWFMHLGFIMVQSSPQI